ncbi:unnamed protein product, partial [marine sediment metagenome]
PALRIGGDPNKREKGIYKMMSGIGAHEVIIETPHHIEDVFYLEDKVVEEMLWGLPGEDNRTYQKSSFPICINF